MGSFFINFPYLYNMVVTFTCQFCFMPYLHAGQIMSMHVWPSYLYQGVTLIMSYIGVYGAVLKKEWVLISVNTQNYTFSIHFFPYTILV